jgi:hypothetical protein
MRIKFIDMFFKDGVYQLTFKKSSVEIQVNVKIVKDQYPIIPPYFTIEMLPLDVDYEIPQHLRNLVDEECLKLRNENLFYQTAFHHIEDELNIIVPREIGCDLNLLDHQISHLVECLHIYMREDGVTETTIVDSKKREISTKFCLKSTLGKDRKRSYKYNEKLGMFTQRF